MSIHHIMLHKLQYKYFVIKCVNEIPSLKVKTQRLKEDNDR